VVGGEIKTYRCRFQYINVDPSFMFRKENLLITITVIAALLLATFGVIKEVRDKTPVVQPLASGYVPGDGQSDRAYWSDLLYKIAYPVVHNLSAGTLRKNMPLETSPKYIMQAEKVSYLEALGRTMAGIAPWLALPDDNSPEGVKRKTLRTELLKGISNAVNPASPDYLNFRSENQPIVDAGCIAHGFLRAYDALWVPLDPETKKRVITEFKSLRDRSGPDNNWVFLAAIREAFLLKAGEEADMPKIQLAIDRIPKWYKGDGWYSDGDHFSIDYYNSHVLHPVIVDLLKVTTEKGITPDSTYQLAVRRMVRHAEFLERIISPEGTYPVFGRSITYRTGAFQALSQVALMEQLPPYIEPAQVRSALTAVMHNLYDHPGNFDKDGWLVLGFNSHQPVVADAYTSTGSLYMATLGFLALGLPAESRFWSDPGADWTSRKAWTGAPFMKDYHVDY
jgi:hypothetical protein